MLLHKKTTMSGHCAGVGKAGSDFSGENYFFKGGFSGEKATAAAGQSMTELDLKLFSDDGEGALSTGGTVEQKSDGDFDALVKGEYKDAFTRRCQRLIDKRFRETKELEEFKSGAVPILEFLSGRLGISATDTASILDALKREAGALALGKVQKSASGNEPTGASGKAEEVASGNELTGTSGKAEDGSSGVLTGTYDKLEKGSSGVMTGTSDKAEDGSSGVLTGTSDKAEEVASGKAEAEALSREVAEEANGEKGRSEAEERYKMLRRDFAKRRFESAKSIYDNMIAEADELKNVYSSFELEKECRSPAFTALLGCGMSVRDAFEAVHKDRLIGEAMEYTAKAVAEALSHNLQYRGARPAENSLAAVSAPPAKRPVASMSESEIMEIVRKVERGEKIRL